MTVAVSAVALLAKARAPLLLTLMVSAADTARVEESHAAVVGGDLCAAGVA